MVARRSPAGQGASGGVRWGEHARQRISGQTGPAAPGRARGTRGGAGGGNGPRWRLGGQPEGDERASHRVGRRSGGPFPPGARAPQSTDSSMSLPGSAEVYEDGAISRSSPRVKPGSQNAMLGEPESVW